MMKTDKHIVHCDKKKKKNQTQKMTIKTNLRWVQNIEVRLSKRRDTNLNTPGPRSGEM